MNKIATDKEMIDFLIDCTLATVEDLILKKTFHRKEFERQCLIAQAGIEYLGEEYPFKSRAKQVIKSKQTVQLYYLSYRL